LQRHKQHISPSTVFEKEEIGGSQSETEPVLSQLEVTIRHCNDAVNYAKRKKDVSGMLRALKELRAHLELKNRLMQSDKPKYRVSTPALNQASVPDRQQGPEDVYTRIQILTLQIRIRSACVDLGEPTTIADSRDLEYLEKAYAKLSSRLETRWLLQLSKVLAGIPIRGYALAVV
jgi:hypothetical protein